MIPSKRSNGFYVQRGSRGWRDQVSVGIQELHRKPATVSGQFRTLKLPGFGQQDWSPLGTALLRTPRPKYPPPSAAGNGQFGSHHQDVQPTTRSLTQVPQCICSSAFALQPRSEGGTAMGRSNLLQEAKYSPSSHTPRPTEDADAAHLTSAPQVRRGVSPRLSALARAADWRGREISPLRDDWLVPNPTSR